MLTPSQLPVTLKQFIAMPRETEWLELIKPYDPENKSRKHAKYIPSWA